jgi:hypothetical protein
VTEPVTPQEQYQQQLQAQFGTLGTRQGLWRSNLQEYFSKKLPDLYDLFSIRPTWEDDQIRRHVRTEMCELRDKIPHLETAADKRLRPDKLDEFNSVFDATFNLAPTFNSSESASERWEDMNLSISSGQRYKVIFVAELARLTLTAGFVPKVELEITDEAEPEVPEVVKPEEELPAETPCPSVEVTPEAEESTLEVEEIPEPKHKKSVAVPMPALWAIGLFVVVALGVLSFFALNRDNNTETPPSTGQLSARNAAPGASSEQPSAGTDQDLIFDDLGASFHTIVVYPGTSESDADKRQNAIYTNGETKRATCKEEGRMAHTNTARGEPDRSSNHWFKIVGIPGQNEYARAIYTKNADELWAKLPYC